MRHERKNLRCGAARQAVIYAERGIDWSADLQVADKTAIYAIDTNVCISSCVNTTAARSSSTSVVSLIDLWKPTKCTSPDHSQVLTPILHGKRGFLDAIVEVQTDQTDISDIKFRSKWIEFFSLERI
jgi:hypothetical protein